MEWLPKLVDLTGSTPDLTRSSPDLTGLSVPGMVTNFVIRNYAISADTICSSTLQRTSVEQKLTATYPFLKKLINNMK